MATLASTYPAEQSHDRLGFAICVALALHAAIILGISFNRQDRAAAPPKLEITLAQHRSQKAPDKADFLAQSNQEGSGTLDHKAMLTTREHADFQDNTIREVTPPQQVSASQQRDGATVTLTTRAKSSQKAQRRDQQEKKPDNQQQLINEISILKRSLEIASLEAKLDIQRQAYAKRPRIRRLTSVATKQSDDALYLHNWRTRIEAIGNRNYPAKSRSQGIYGQLRLMVSLLPNGEVHEVKVLESSGQKILDEAAIRIVHLASPYAAFPSKMGKEVDILEIIRTWRFHKNRLSSSN